MSPFSHMQTRKTLSQYAQLSRPCHLIKKIFKYVWTVKALIRLHICDFTKYEITTKFLIRLWICRLILALLFRHSVRPTLCDKVNVVWAGSLLFHSWYSDAESQIGRALSKILIINPIPVGSGYTLPLQTV